MAAAAVTVTTIDANALIDGLLKLASPVLLAAIAVWQMRQGRATKDDADQRAKEQREDSDRKAEEQRKAATDIALSLQLAADQRAAAAEEQKKILDHVNSNLSEAKAIGIAATAVAAKAEAVKDVVIDQNAEFKKMIAALQMEMASLRGSMAMKDAVAAATQTALATHPPVAAMPAAMATAATPAPVEVKIVDQAKPVSVKPVDPV